MIKINDYTLNDEEEDTVRIALEHYEMLWWPDSPRYKTLGKRTCEKIIKTILKLIDLIIKDYPEID